MAAVPVFIGLGSNSVRAISDLKSGLEQLRKHPDLEFSQVSSFYQTEPQEFKDQPWFTNAVAKFYVNSSLTPVRLIEDLLKIEALMGRKRDPSLPRFGPRVLDLDLLLYGDEVLNLPNCTIPHPRMFQRAFVLVPLLEIEPDLCVQGQPVSAYLAALDYRLEGGKIYQP